MARSTAPGRQTNDDILMLLSHSAWRRVLTTTGIAAGFVLAYQATMFDSKFAARQALLVEGTAEPAAATRLQFAATAYCKGEITASGVVPHTGIAAADPDLLPVGSVVQIASDDQHYSGIYTIMDTGPMIVGRHIDIYLWNCNEALQFGRRAVHVTVLRLGWNPKATAPRLLDALMPWRDRPAPPPARLPATPITSGGPASLPPGFLPGK
jgi:3D (Asp-Asp-Asp) domain-containing protein